MGEVLLLGSAGLSASNMAVAAESEGRLLLGRAFGGIGCGLLAARGSAFSLLIGSTLAASLTLLGSLDSDLVG